MKVWRKRIIRFSFRSNPSSPVFAHTLLAMSLLGGYLVLGLGTAGVLAYVGLRTDSTRGPWHHLLVQFCGIACALISASTSPAWRRFVAGIRFVVGKSDLRFMWQPHEYPLQSPQGRHGPQLRLCRAGPAFR